MFSKLIVSALVAGCLLVAPAASAPHRVQDRATATTLSLQQPTNTLPPPTGLVLKYVALGLGTQNYTCTNPGSTAAPGTTGAKATLYDIGTRLNTDPLAPWKIPVISGLALNLSPYPDVLQGWLAVSGYNTVLGHHYFSATKVPTFALDNVKMTPYPQVNSKKNAAEAAPTDACPGRTNEGAVPWLQLTDAGGSQGGVNTVYRLETAGGSAPATCQNVTTPTFNVDYAAQYWIYGPA